MSVQVTATFKRSGDANRHPYSYVQYETVTEALREFGSDEVLRRINYSVKWNAQIKARQAEHTRLLELSKRILQRSEEET